MKTKLCLLVGILLFVLFSNAAALSCFYDAAGEAVAWFDVAGNLNITGSLVQGNATWSTNFEGLKIYNLSGNPVAAIECSSGDIKIAGTCYPSQSTLLLSNACFVVRYGSGSDNAVAYFDNSGNLYLKGVVSSVSFSDEGGGGAIYNANSSPIIENCTFAGNAASTMGGGIFDDENSALTIKNSILWDNRAIQESLQIHSANAIVQYSCIQEARSGTGNIFACPYFVDPGQGDYHLKSYSSCIDAGDPASIYVLEPEPNGGRINMGAYGNTPEAESASADDGDGIPDAWELEYLGTLAYGANDHSDTDGLTNLQEYQNGTNPKNSDSDNDGLNDQEEITRGTDPLDADSDNDTFIDSLEILKGSNPRDPGSTPSVVSGDVTFTVEDIGNKRIKIKYTAAQNITIRSLALGCYLHNAAILDSSDILSREPHFNYFMDYVKDNPGAGLGDGHPIAKLESGGVPVFIGGVSVFSLNMACLDDSGGQTPAPAVVDNLITIQLHGSGTNNIRITEDTLRSSFGAKGITTNLPIMITVDLD